MLLAFLLHPDGFRTGDGKTDLRTNTLLTKFFCMNWAPGAIALTMLT
jgi:hypothetical protein